MTEASQGAARFLRDSDRDAHSSVSAADLLGRLGELTEELAEAKLRQEQAESALKKTKRELTSERSAHKRTTGELQAERTRTEEVEAERDWERLQRTMLQANLKSVEERSEALEHQVKAAWSQLQAADPEPQSQPWWRRFGS